MRNPIFRFNPRALYRMQETFAMAAGTDNSPIIMLSLHFPFLLLCIVLRM